MHGLTIHTMMVLIIACTLYAPTYAQQNHIAAIHISKYHCLSCLQHKADILQYLYFSSTFRFFSTLMWYQPGLYKLNQPPTSRRQICQLEPQSVLSSKMKHHLRKYKRKLTITGFLEFSNDPRKLDVLSDQRLTESWKTWFIPSEWT